MPTRPSSAGKKGGKKGDKKGKKKTKTPTVDPHQEQIDSLIREREEIRSKLNVLCTKIIENINMDDYQNDIDLTKQQPSDVSIDHLLTMIDQICYYRVAFLNLFQEIDDNERIPIEKKITQLAVDQPDIFRKRLTSDQRLTFVIRERDLWKENAQLLQIMYGTIVDQLEMETFKKPTPKTDEILRNHRLNLEDVCLIFSAPRIRSINDAQKVREKKNLDVVLNDLREQHAFFDLEQPTKSKEISDNHDLLTNEIPLKYQSSIRNNQIPSVRRSVSFADEVNVLNDYDENDLNQQIELPSTVLSHENDLNSLSFINSSSLIISNERPIEQRITEMDYYTSSTMPSSYQQQYIVPIQSKYNLPSKFRLPLAREILVNKMDSNLRMLIIKELSKSGHSERPLSRMSKINNHQTNSRQQDRRQSSRTSTINESSPEWVELARLIGIDESEIDHWLSQNLQYPAGRVISAWCNYASPPPTVAELHSVVLSNEINRPDLARYIETMYIIE